MHTKLSSSKKTTVEYSVFWNLGLRRKILYKNVTRLSTLIVSYRYFPTEKSHCKFLWFFSLIQMHRLSGRFRKMIRLSLSFLMKKVEHFSICFQRWWCQLLIVIHTLLYTHTRAAWMEILTTVSKYQEGQHHIWMVFCRFSSVGTEANTLREKMWASQLFLLL